MDIVSFLVGFFTLPIVALIEVFMITRQSMVKPTKVNDSGELQKCIRKHFLKGKNNSVLYIQNRKTEFLIRVTKVKRKVKKNTLNFEVRVSENAREYESVKDLLTKNEIEFQEKLTPNTRQPSRLYIKYREGGIYTVVSIAGIIVKISSYLEGSRELGLLVSRHDPLEWQT